MFVSEMVITFNIKSKHTKNMKDIVITGLCSKLKY